VRPFHVAAWIEDFPGSKPTIKQKLAAVRMLYDFLIVRQITPSNPAHSVRGPKYVVKKGKTPVWSREDAKTLLDSIPKDSVSGLRDLALIAAMFYSFARVSAVLNSKSTTTIIMARAGGSDSMKKVVRSTKCQSITCSSRS
jgi:site-specific recombinase XerD